MVNNGECLDLIIMKFEWESMILQLNVYSTNVFFHPPLLLSLLLYLAPLG